MRTFLILAISMTLAGCVGARGNNASDEKVNAVGAGVSVSSTEVAAIVAKRNGVPAAGVNTESSAPSVAVTVSHE